VAKTFQEEIYTWKNYDWKEGSRVQNSAREIMHYIVNDVQCVFVLSINYQIYDLIGHLHDAVYSGCQFYQHICFLLCHIIHNNIIACADISRAPWTAKRRWQYKCAFRNNRICKQWLILLCCQIESENVTLIYLLTFMYFTVRHYS
jgi:hypothetical protein